MKKIFSFFSAMLIVFVLHAQSYQLNVTLTADEWGYISANYKGTDSIGSRFERKLRDAVQANLPISTWTKNITVDTVPNAVVIWTYSKWKSMPAGLRDLYGNSVINKINLIGNSEIVAERNKIDSVYISRRDTEIRPEAKRNNIDN